MHTFAGRQYVVLRYSISLKGGTVADMGAGMTKRLRWHAVLQWSTIGLLLSAALFGVCRMPASRQVDAASSEVPLGEWRRWLATPTTLDLRGVVTTGVGEAWAVGGRAAEHPAADTAVVLHYRRGEWVLVELPDSAQQGVRFTAVDATGPDNVWVAGQAYRAHLSETPLPALYHFDGATWRHVELPASSLAAGLTDVDVVATAAGREVWAISRANGQATSYIFHFDGRAWTYETRQNRALLALHMLSADEGQMVSAGAGGAPDGHHYWYRSGFWQGTSVWTPQPLYGVSMAEPTYGWAVGAKGATDEYIGECHTSGTQCRWLARQAVRSVDDRAISPDLWDVELVSREEGWVVGEPWGRRSTIARLTEPPRPNWRAVEVVDDPRQPLYGLGLVSDGGGTLVEGWAVGAGGTILQYSRPLSEETPSPTATAPVTPTISPTPNPTITATPSPQPPRASVFLPLVMQPHLRVQLGSSAK